jgi:hypothetical protein
MTEFKGIDAIREKLIASNRKINTAGLSTDCGLAPHQISAFMEGRNVPPAAALCALAKRFWPHAKFDPERNVLIAGADNQAYTLLPEPPGNFIPDANCLNLAEVAKGPRGLREEKPTPKAKTTRPGWVGGLW